MEETFYQVWLPCTSGRTIREFLDSLVLPATYQELASKWHELGRPHLYSLHSRLTHGDAQTTMQCCNLDDFVALQDLMCLEMVSHHLKRQEDGAPERPFDQTASYIHLYTLVKVELDAKQYQWNEEMQRDRFEAYWRQALLFLDMNRSTCHLASPHPCLHTALWGDCIHLPTRELFKKFELWLSAQAPSPLDSSQLFSHPASVVSSSPSLAEENSYRDQRRQAISISCSPSFSNDTRDRDSSIRSFIDDTDWMAGMEGFAGNCGIFDIGIHQEQDTMYSIPEPDAMEPSSSSTYRPVERFTPARHHSNQSPSSNDDNNDDYDDAAAGTASPSEQDRIEQNRRKSQRYYLKRKRQRDLLREVTEQFSDVVLLPDVGAGEASTSSSQRETKTGGAPNRHQRQKSGGASRTANERKWQSKCSLKEAEKKHIQRISNIALLTNTLYLNGSLAMEATFCHASIGQSQELRHSLLEQWSMLRSRWDELVSAEKSLLSLEDGPVSRLVRSLRENDELHAKPP